MLVLSRKAGQEIVLVTDQGDVRIMVLGIRGDNVKLGIDAPKSMAIHRDEVPRAILMADVDK
jgi:carbon storage regulator